MNKMKKVLKYVAVLFYFTIIGIVSIILLTGAFRFAISCIENRSPDTLEWIGIISVGLILGSIGLVYFILNDCIETNKNIHPLAVENMKRLEVDAIAMLNEHEQIDRCKDCKYYDPNRLF